MWHARTPGYVFGNCAAQGRPLDGLILRFCFRRATIDGAAWMRLAAVTGIALQGWTISLAVVRAGFRRVDAVLVGCAVCLLPASQIDASWATLVAEPWAAALGGFAGLIAWTTLDDWLSCGGGRRLARLAVAVVVMVTALSVYQPSAMLFCAIALVDVLGRYKAGTKETLGRAIIYAAVAGAALIGGWVIFSIGTHAYSTLVDPHRAGITHESLAKCRWFLSEVLPNVLNFSNICPSTTTALVVAALLVTGLMLHFQGAIPDRVLRLCLGAIALPAAYLPNLIASESWSSYRTQTAIGASVVVLAFFALTGFARALGKPVLSIVFPVLVATAAITAATNVTRYITFPQSIELAMVREALLARGPVQTLHVLLIQPTVNDSAAPAWRYDEFGQPSTFVSWGARPIAKLVRRDAFGPSVWTPVTVITPDQLPGLTLDPDTVLLDMRNLKYAR
jgi:hypothetical protein